jgi:hypothetical protein
MARDPNADAKHTIAQKIMQYEPHDKKEIQFSRIT